MNKKTEACMPRLRFPEFREAGEWVEKRLGDYSTIVRGGSPRPIDSFLTTDNNGLHWLKISDVDKEAKYITSTKERVRPEALSSTRVINPGDLVLSNSMSFGRPYISSITTCIHDGWIAIREITTTLCTDFIYYIIEGPSSQQYFIDSAAGGGVQNLNAEIIKLLPTLLPPSLPEQQKIADCLTSLDTLLTAHSAKLDALKEYKKGLLQQLFPAEGERVPRLRFPEFAGAGEWEEKRLDRVCELQDGFTFPSELFINDSENSIQVIRITDINNHNKNIDKVYVTNSTFERLGLQKYSVQKGELLLSLTGAAGFNFFLWNSSFALLNQRTMKISLKDSKDSALKILLPTLIHHKINEKGEGQNNNLSKELLKKISFFIPQLPEQQRIADCLASLDTLITAQGEKIAALKEHKKGLLQQLFPQGEGAGA